MSEPTQLLCTFASVDDIDIVVAEIKNTYDLTFNKLYVLQNVDDAAQRILTYNVARTDVHMVTPPPSTISVHRKKLTNSIYTINALNKLIESKNNGKLDPSYKIDWEELKNTILVTAYGQLKIIKTKLIDIIDI